MANKKVSRRALFTSIMSLILCCALLVGTTFAWFTDSVTSANNIIKSGTLDVEMYWADGTEDPENVTWKDASHGAIFDYDKWEPGYTEVRHIKIENTGSLALNYRLAIVANGDPSILTDVIDVYFVNPAVKVADRTQLNEDYNEGILHDILEGMPTNASGSLEAGQNDTVTIALKMQESAGNEYQNLSIGSDFKVILQATQMTSEEDSFDANYDAGATYGGSASGSAPEGAAGFELEVHDDNRYKIGSFVFPEGSYVEDSDVSVQITKTEGNITVGDGLEQQGFDVVVKGLKENNTVPVKVQLRIPVGLNPETVVLYHYDEEIECTYNPHTGYVTFETANFSPFTVVYDAESEYVPPVAEEGDLPKADVTPYTETENIVWGNYDPWSPTPGLEANLEAAYTFTCVESEEAAKQNPYANWYCDFYVKLDRDLAANQIFLGGHYGSFGWIGFHNGDITLAANEEIALLGSVTANPWTYLDIADNVGKFICGVGDVDDALSGATFTVHLRLTNPENEAEFYNVATITHTFN